MAIDLLSRTRVACYSFVLSFLSLFLAAYSSRHPEAGQLGRLVVAEVTSPILGLVDAARRSGLSVIDGYIVLVGAKRENSELHTRVEQLENDLLAREEMRLENERLRSLLGLAEEQKLVGVSARVIGSTPSGWVQGIVVNRGSSHGVHPGMAVVSSQGVVGQVVSSAPHAAHVILVTDHSSGVDALVQDGRVRGVVSGVGSRKCVLRYVRKEEQIQVGDLVVTSGMDRVYPKGINVGRISAIEESGGALFKEISVLPAVDFSKLEEVFVVAVSAQSSVPENTVPLKRDGDVSAVSGRSGRR
jgi:rod shape-determining protein MreC